MNVKTSDNVEESPLWLRNLVRLGRFFRNCESHHSKVCNFYCINCLGVAICPKCKDQHATCGRKILTAYKASREAALRTEDVKSIFNISDICFYIINKKNIVFIQRKGRNGRTGDGHGYERCQNCSYRIRSPNNYCSIECKVDFIERRNEADTSMDVEMEWVEEADAGAESTTEEPVMETSTTEELIMAKSIEEVAMIKPTTEEPVVPKSYRKRPRKGIPYRAPFF